ncbi:cytochrome b-c1 complex subunit 7-like [Microtus oregoni]|uniref:cytochrome b-c1 complex subunit 7-like n=1 Tax=Microtus oregoni TaxID=111838 RepID=UPI001BB2A117|nr:cytochrome b-c1 complex subunit 7-like [Microtus oregoni]
MRGDTLHETEDVKEAIRRLPEHLYNDGMFRIKRALDLSMQHQILPKEQWTKYEEDKFYLKSYLKEVIRERKEKEDGQRSDLVVEICGCAWSQFVVIYECECESPQTSNASWTPLFASGWYWPVRHSAQKLFDTEKNRDPVPYC